MHQFNFLLDNSEKGYFPTVDLESLSLDEVGKNDMHVDNLGMSTCYSSDGSRIRFKLHHMSWFQFLRGQDKVGRIYGITANRVDRDKVRVGRGTSAQSSTNSPASKSKPDSTKRVHVDSHP